MPNTKQVGCWQLEKTINEILQVNKITDYCPNGLQVEGRHGIRRLVTGVTASQAFLEQAVALGADAVLVHHGLFWKSDPPVLLGFRKKRLATVLANHLNVFAYHLPLDVHPKFGNNVQLGLALGWHLERTIGEKDLVCIGRVSDELTVAQWMQRIELLFGRSVQCIGDAQRLVRTVAWCTGAAASFVELVAATGADIYLTGELSEPAVHVALETGVTLLGAGHHATERGGVQALGRHLSEVFGIEVIFVDVPVPV